MSHRNYYNSNVSAVGLSDVFQLFLEKNLEFLNFILSHVWVSFRFLILFLPLISHFLVVILRYVFFKNPSLCFAAPVRPRREENGSKNAVLWGAVSKIYSKQGHNMYHSHNKRRVGNGHRLFIYIYIEHRNLKTRKTLTTSQFRYETFYYLSV